ncbi:type II secretion system protein [Dechloromonas denitrificans]|uniref:type II secretion system protein n=1 Tax=Dechloromonas denitrificans TaxID=281362 RepID=UPI001CFAF354|nr:type II secretion system protein [Dechloromonas denitrificans]UCV08768.1 type II secretion system protein [Dechloromonas denitrificans]
MKLMDYPIEQRLNRGFTLVELAIVLIIVSLLTGGLIMAVAGQRDGIAISETQRRLNDARDALMGFAAVTGRLPCPAAPGTTGIEAPSAGGICSNPWDGFLPAITLGLMPVNENGYAVDGWGNPIRYGVSTEITSQLTTANQIKTAWNAGSSLAGDLRICNSATAISGAGSIAVCALGSELAANAVAVIFSRGKNGGTAPSSADEIANGDGDRLFVSHTPTPAGANEFDDLVVWLSPNILYNRMIAAGRLP